MLRPLPSDSLVPFTRLAPLPQILYSFSHDSLLCLRFSSPFHTLRPLPSDSLVPFARCAPLPSDSLVPFTRLAPLPQIL